MNSRQAFFQGVSDQYSENDNWLIHRNNTDGRQKFLLQAKSIASALPNKRYMVLLTTHRLNFIRSFVAAQFAQQTVLLPSNSSPGAISEILDSYPDSYCMVDEPLPSFPSDNRVLQVNCNDFQNSDQVERVVEQAIDPDHIAAIAFTSGTTGSAKPYPKSWTSLVHGAYLAKRRFGFECQHSIVATVPSQHMYGLETTVMVPLIVGSRLFADKPFYPEDIRLALQQCPDKRVLVTTPIHLRACVAAGLNWPTVDMIISATAPLHEQLLQQATETFNAPVLEIYGCTEAGSLASRDPINSVTWKLYDDFRISIDDERAVVSAHHLSEEVELSDVVKMVEQDQFLLLGRHADMVNIAGKRASLNDLNIKLNAIEGVKDGIFILPDSAEQKTARLTALVVAADVAEEDILLALASQIDSVFLPRPLYKVDTLPRNETGKITRASLLRLINDIEDVA